MHKLGPIAFFLILVSALAAIGYSLAFAMGDANRAPGLLIVQFAPMAAAFLSALLFRRTLRGFGWGWGKWRFQLTAWALPFLIALISFSLIWLSGFGELKVGPFVEEAQAGLAEAFGFDLKTTLPTLLVVVVINATLGLFVAFGAVGEELGWRGFLVPELIKKFSYTKTSFISGTIWAVYHFPLLIFLLAPRLEVSAFPLLISILIGGIALTFIINWLRIRSGSVWTAVIFHAALNIHVQGFFQNVTRETSWLSNYVSGEYGFMLALVGVGFAYWFWSNRRRLGPAMSPTLI